MAERYAARLILAALLIVCIGCRRPPADAPFHRFVEDVLPGQRWHEVKVRIGHETRNVLSAPHRSALKEIEVHQDGTIALEEVAQIEKVSADSAGIRVCVEQSLVKKSQATQNPAARVYVPLPSKRDPADLALTRIQIVPAGEERTKICVSAREVVALPQEHVTKEVRVPQSALLDFGIGLEGDVSGAPFCDVLFTVAVERGRERETVFSEVLELEPDEDGPGWVDVTLELAELAGSRVRFVFRTERASGEEEERKRANVPLFDWSPVWSGPILYSAESERAPDKPNIIFISLDTLRADHLGCYGYHRATSPNIDKFAETAFLFENCIASSSWTLPSHASLFTGVHPSVHGAEVPPWGPPFADTETTLGELARERGYLTAAYTEGCYVSASLGFAQGFALYSDGRDLLLNGCVEVTFSDALQWLETYGGLPFFLFVHTYQVHTPYKPPRRFGEMFDENYAEAGWVNPEKARSKEDKIRCEALYDGEIAYTDKVLGDFLRRLEEMQLLQNTAVIIFSDHGEEFWDHGGIKHGVTLYDEMLRVPLIIRLAGENPPAGRVARQVSLTDLYATVAELLGVDDENPPDCMSLLPLVSGSKTRVKYDRKIVMSQVCHRNDPSERLGPNLRTRSIRTDGEKYIKFEKEQREEMYDLVADPHEKNDISADNEQALLKYRAMLDSFLETVSAGRKPISVEERVGPLTEERRRQLRALGYM